MEAGSPASRQATAVASAGSVETARAVRQPQRTITQERSGGAIADPRAIAAMTKPFARPRLSGPIQRATPPAAAGNVGAWPMPSTKRRAMRAASVDAAPAANGPRPTSTCRSVAPTHHHEASSRTRRVPQRSASAPPGTMKSA